MASLPKQSRSKNSYFNKSSNQSGKPNNYKEKSKEITTNSTKVSPEKSVAVTENEEAENTDFDTTWDIDEYKTEYENEEHWELRKRFMEFHKKKYPEDRLVCLAQTFTNIEFMGCKYSADLMQLIGELSQDVAKDFREERSKRLKRTFVSAGEAAEQRAKGRRTATPATKARQQQTYSNQDQPSTSRQAWNNYHNNSGGNYNQNWSNTNNSMNATNQNWRNFHNEANIPRNSWNESHQDWRNSKNQSDTSRNSWNEYNQAGPSRNVYQNDVRQPRDYDRMHQNDPRRKKKFGDGGDDLYDNLPYGKFVVFLRGGRNCLRECAYSNSLTYEERADFLNGQSLGEILIDGNVIAKTPGENSKAAKTAAFNEALNILQKECYSIKLNADRDIIKVKKIKNQLELVVSKDAADGIPVANDNKLDKTNKGFKMMRMMGWTGGGLGSQQQGREDPVAYLLKDNRLGLGAASTLDAANYTKMLQNYQDSDDIRDLQFEPTFSKEDRATLHKIANKFQLRSSSHGFGDDRCLIISKKISYDQILNEVLKNQNPKYCDRYFVQVPESKFSQYPGHCEQLQLDNWNQTDAS